MALARAMAACVFPWARTVRATLNAVAMLATAPASALGEACSPIGETCDTEGTDDGCCSKYCENLGSEEEPDLRCSRSSTCGARGEICDRSQRLLLRSLRRRSLSHPERD